MEHGSLFRRHGPFTISELARRADAEISEEEHSSVLIHDIKPLADACARDLSFLDNTKYLAALKATTAGACFINPELRDNLPAGTVGLLTRTPYRAFAKALAMFYPDASRPLVCEGQDEPVSSTAKIEDGAVLQPGVMLGPETHIGTGTTIASGAVIGRGVTIGRNCYIGPNANVTHAVVGDRVLVHAGVCIGQDGFGFAMGGDGHLKVPQIGRVIIQDDVEIGANSTIDRGALNDTIIGEGSKIDNLVQIAHNVVVGRHCVIAGQAGISGSVVLEDFVVMGGKSGCVGHITLGAGSQIAGNSGVAQSVPRGERWCGSPARPMAQFSREVAVLKSLGETLKGKALARFKRLLD